MKEKRLSPFDQECINMGNSLFMCEPHIFKNDELFDLVWDVHGLDVKIIKAVKDALQARFGERFIEFSDKYGNDHVNIVVKYDNQNFPDVISYYDIDKDVSTGLDYMRKPEYVKAIIFNDSRFEDLIIFTGGGELTSYPNDEKGRKYTFIDQNGKYMDVLPGDVIICRENGDYDVMRLDEFEKHFEHRF